MADHATVVVAEPGADPQRLDQLTGYLRAELAALDGVAVASAPADAPPEGARAVDVAAAGALVVAIARSDALRAVIDVVRRWLSSSPQPGRTIRVQIDGDVLELSNASPSAEADLVGMFVHKHG